jgi:hypothetical protein
MALQIAALNDEPFIFVISTNSSAFPLWDLSRTGGAYYPLSDCLAGVAVRRTDSAQAEMNPQIIPSRLNCLEPALAIPTDVSAYKIDVVRRLSILPGSEGTAACLWDFSPIGNSSLDWAPELFLT